MRELGLNVVSLQHLRGAASCPQGTGAVNARGLDFYDRLVDALLANEHRSRWSRSITGICRRRSTTAAAGSTATSPTGSPTTRTVLFRALDDRVPMWATLNEPWVVTRRRLPARRARARASQPVRGADRHRTTCCARTARRCRRIARAGKHADRPRREPRAQVSGVRHDPRTSRRRARRRVHEPAVSRSGVPRPLSRRAARDLRRGVAATSRRRLRAHPASRSTSSASTTTRAASTRDDRRRAGRCARARVRQPQHAYTETGWEVYPARRSRDILVWVKERYGDMPLYVTENGAAFYDPPHADRRRGRRSAARLVLPRASARGARRDRAGRRPARLLRLVAARQLRVEPRLREALRHRARRLRRRRSARPRRARATTREVIRTQRRHRSATPLDASRARDQCA